MMHPYMALLLLMIILVTHGYTLLLTNMKCRKSSNDFSSRASTNFGGKIKHIRSDNGTEFKNSGLDDYLDELGLLMSYLLLILLSKMASWNARTEFLLRWLALCLMNIKRLIVFGLMQLILRATSSTEYIFTNSSRRRPMYSSLTRNPM